MFAIRNDDYPGGWFYRFQYYHPDEGPILRYDNAHDDADLGTHHRHIRDGEDAEIEFDGLVLHVAQFLQEVGELAERHCGHRERGYALMNDTEHDGWPDEYRDPRDRPHPDVLRVTVETGDEARDEVVETAEATASDESPPAVVSFASVAELRKILTDRRIELLQALTDIDGAAESITALSESLDRDYRAVHEDVTLLADYGLVFTVEEGQSKRPYLPYKRIHLDVELVGHDHGEEPAPA